MGNLWPYKNHHYRSKCLIVLLQEHCEKIQFKSGHPVCMYIVNELDFPSYFDLSSGTTLKIIIYFMDLNPGLGTVFLVV